MTLFNKKGLVSLDGTYYIGGYSSGAALNDVGTSFTFDRVVNTGTGGGLPLGHSTKDRYGYTRQLWLPIGAGRPGVYSCSALGTTIQTVVLAENGK